jgi:hypothetical protein
LSLGALTLSAADPVLGTWKMNVAKSKFSPGPAPKAITSTYTQDGDWIVIKTEGTESAGQAVNRENRYKMDGQEYPFETAQGKGTISINKIDDHTGEAVLKFPGGHTINSRSVISKDGKTRTMTSRGTNAKGEKVTSVVVWERQ